MATGFRHVVLLTFRDGTPAGHAELVAEALRALPGAIPELRNYEIGLDAGLADHNSHVAVVADFDDQAGYETYRDHPAHVQIITEMIRPHLADRAAVQHRRT